MNKATIDLLQFTRKTVAEVKGYLLDLKVSSNVVKREKERGNLGKVCTSMTKLA